MNGQMDIFSFLDKSDPEPESTYTPPELKYEHETDPGYLGSVSEEYALQIRGRQLKFAELENLTDKRILWRCRTWLHGKDGTRESNRYKIVKVLTYVPDREEIYDYESDREIGSADGCLVQDKAGHPPLAFWLNELYIFEGKDVEEYGYKKREFLYEVTEDSE